MTPVELSVSLGQSHLGWHYCIKFEVDGTWFWSQDTFPTSDEAEVAMFKFTNANGINVIHTAVGQA